MADHNAIRSNPPAQPQPKPEHPSPRHQLKADYFEALRHLNRGYGVALAALDRLESKDRLHAPRAFPSGFLNIYRNRTEALRALANRDLLRLLAEREELEAGRFGASPEKPDRKPPRS
ncbi:MAG: hypothetical protein LAO78_25740 [Acidobacteriia bacterium]|nr:hypothetical protein [Terriglobia bacterium]